MNEKLKKDLEDLKNKYMQEGGMDPEAEELAKFIQEKLSMPVEAARKQEMEERALAKKLEEQLIQDREQQGQEDYEKQLKAMRMKEYEKEIEEKGFADKSKYSDLFPESVEISPMQRQEREKKRLGYK